MLFDMKFSLLYLVFVTVFVNGVPSIKEVIDQPQICRDEEPECCRTISEHYPDLSDWSFNPRDVPTEDTACLSLWMFGKMDFLQQFNISANTLFGFILQIKSKYQNMPYHNWSHGFNVLHFTFTVLKNCKLIDKQHVTPMEGLALMTAAMSHDVDHPGTNNMFQKVVNSSLAEAYGDQGSILERHHIAVTLEVLSKPEMNFLTSLDKVQYENFKELLKHIILATDLAVHFTLQGEEQKMAAEGFDKHSERDRHMLLSVIISCADLSDQTRDWPTVRRVAKLIFTEFFAQGDREKQLGVRPSKMMDRLEAKIPQLQVDFLSHIVIPNFKVLLSLYPETQIFMDTITNNLANWWKAVPYFEEETIQGRDQMEILDDSQLDNLYNLTETKHRRSLFHT